MEQVKKERKSPDTSTQPNYSDSEESRRSESLLRLSDELMQEIDELVEEALEEAEEFTLAHSIRMGSLMTEQAFGMFNDSATGETCAIGAAITYMRKVQENEFTD
jgi:hypothetical protein